MGVGLQTARALVVDDVLEEAQPVLLALSRLGMGAVYLDGNLDALAENERLRGIRLVFVDMDLQGDGTTPPEEYGRLTAQYLAMALSPDNGMISALVWTNHPGAAESFYAELRTRLSDSAVLQIGVAKKPVRGGEQATVDRILSHVNEWLESAPGVRMLWEWEQVTHEAVTATTEDLVEVVGKGQKINLADTDSVSSGLVSTLGLLASTAADRPPQTGIEAATQAFSALVPILEDRTEHASERFRSIKEQHLGDFLSAANDSDLWSKQSDEQRTRAARLNRMVHVSRRPLPGHPLLPGNVYEIRGDLDETLPFDADQVVDNIGAARKDQVPEGIRPIPVIAEVSPACDYANAKIGVPRVLGGVLFPGEWLKGRVPSYAYVYSQKFGLFQFDDGEVAGLAAGLFRLAFNARFLAGVSVESLAKGPPLFRIRQNTLVDLQAWLAAYGSRPGVITIAR